jgi:hypothetical protein
MKPSVAITNQKFFSTILKNGTLTLSLKNDSVETIADDEVVVRMEAAPTTSSDLYLMLTALISAKLFKNENQGEISN